MHHFSEKFGELAKAMAKVQGAMRPAVANRDNTHRNSRYADLASVMSTVQPLLSEHGLFLTQPYSQREDGTVMMTTRLIHAESEQWVEATQPIAGHLGDPQKFGSALTYARRYMVASMLGVVTGDEDDDGQRASEPPPQRKGRAHGPQDFNPTNSVAVEMINRIRGSNSVGHLKDIADAIADMKKENAKALTPQENEAVTGAYRMRRAFLANRDKRDAARAKDAVTVTEQQGVTSETDDLGYDQMSKEMQGDAQP